MAFSPRIDTDETRISRMLEIRDEHPDKLVHRAITEAIIGAAFEVHREVGYGFLERVYQRALQVELSRRGLSADVEKRIRVQYKGVVVGDHAAVLVVEDCEAVEVKMNPDCEKRHEAQFVNQLQRTCLKGG